MLALRRLGCGRLPMSCRSSGIVSTMSSAAPGARLLGIAARTAAVAATLTAAVIARQIGRVERCRICGRRAPLRTVTIFALSVAGGHLRHRLGRRDRVASQSDGSSAAFSRYWPSWRCLRRLLRQRAAVSGHRAVDAVGVESGGSAIQWHRSRFAPPDGCRSSRRGGRSIEPAHVSKMPSGFHSLDLASRAWFEDVKRFYTG